MAGSKAPESKGKGPNAGFVPLFSGYVTDDLQNTAFDTIN